MHDATSGSGTRSEPPPQWFTENTVLGRRFGAVEHRFLIEDLVFAGRTAFHEVLIFDNRVYGRVLVLDGIVQLSTSDEHVYHEMLVQPVMLSHPNPKRVLIVGGGDGGALREVLRHEPEQVVMVDLDEAIADLSRRHLPTLSASAFESSRLELVHQDAQVRVRSYSDHFDVVIIDCNDAVGPSVPLFEAPFYADVARALTPSGLVAVQAGSFLDLEFLKTLHRRLNAEIGGACALRSTIPSYHCGEYCFLIVAPERDPRGPEREVLAERIRERRLAAQLRYYTPSLHHASQVMPASMEVACG